MGQAVPQWISPVQDMQSDESLEDLRLTYSSYFFKQFSPEQLGMTGI